MGTRRDTELTDSDDASSARSIDAVLDELRRYRKSGAHTSRTKLSEYPSLIETSGHHDVYDAYEWLIATVRGFKARGDKELSAAVLATFGPGSTILERLESAADQVGNGADQRSARRWADAGMVKLATALVDEGHMRGGRGIHLIDVAYMATNNGECLLLLIRWRALRSALKGDEYVQFRLSDKANWLEDAIWQTRLTPEWEQDIDQDTVAAASFLMELPVFPRDLSLELYFHAPAPPLITQFGTASWGDNQLIAMTHRQLLQFRWFTNDLRPSFLTRSKIPEYEDRLILSEIFRHAGVRVGEV